MSTPSSAPQAETPASDMESVCRWVASLPNMETREVALLELCKRRESVPELAPILWHAFGVVAALLQEICSIYPFLNPPNLSAHQSNRVCNALALMQCLASHPETRKEFLKANIPLYLYTFLNTNNQTRPFEYLRLTSLGVIGALVKTDEPEVIAFLLGSEIIPLCLVIMESGSELSRTVATFIMQKLLLDEVGLAYICQTYERFVHVTTVLEKMVIDLAREQSLRLLKHVIRCYLRLSDNSRARDALRACLPQQLTDGTFSGLLENDVATRRWLTQLIRQLSVHTVGSAATASTTASSVGSMDVTTLNAVSGTLTCLPSTTTVPSSVTTAAPSVDISGTSVASGVTSASVSGSGASVSSSSTQGVNSVTSTSS
uniref:CCR4-NOT transcription complex subunit 9 n=1 Tax=Trichobilharzia regenti TaxID=157069 RepID=A0AA85J9D1_TRIRE|nr:unnamed protein product [Trichobilharzia regenti]CAH8819758.1 unnamed protein product [Trichobilharzia regenti]CAH8874188.1 unnamed protein product [Trichobilharzia regenti]